LIYWLIIKYILAHDWFYLYFTRIPLLFGLLTDHQVYLCTQLILLIFYKNTIIIWFIDWSSSVSLHATDFIYILQEYHYYLIYWLIINCILTRNWFYLYFTRIPLFGLLTDHQVYFSMQLILFIFYNNTIIWSIDRLSSIS